MKRVILIRHSEEPKGEDINVGKIGISEQGGVRTYLLPRMVDKIFNGEPYEVHAYTKAKVGNEYSSRSYLTVQHLKPSKMVLYKNWRCIEQLVDKIKRSSAKNIVVSWRGCNLPGITRKLIGVKLASVDEATERLNDLVEEHRGLAKTYTVTPEDLKRTKLSVKKFQRQNKTVKDYVLSPVQEIKYSIVWDLTFDPTTSYQGALNFYTGFLISPGSGGNWLIEDYLDHLPKVTTTYQISGKLTEAEKEEVRKRRADWKKVKEARKLKEKAEKKALKAEKKLASKSRH